MQIAQIMTKNVHIVSPDDTVAAVARHMADNDIGFLPVEQDDRLVGTITDRDIVVRCVADGRDGDTTVAEVMSADVKYCFEDEEIGDVARNMGDIQVRRLPVLNRDKRLVGVVSLADAARRDPSLAGAGLQGVTAPGGAHNQE
ncbi:MULTISPECIES: CBS domain-containing protein [Ensifer]|uniref:CBS domain-containing protein n=1 Tax=Ensifer TaxID=106591 RepID=UPI00070A04EB|nr:MULTISPECIES: CBS domain-containing protein [Ensifer]KQU96076.1 inosine-5-monophosphate dehydrogenase [Ensifer sp. Root31]KQW34887.1 inosine-5-monophosphate dehydrogenase [Ensifer sp. Root1252]KQY76980.1 inosine-5-monophosphate dehydrogenase [Ensifer sp. Root142]KRC57211.1 inosine-5-monophosphate dehydrogenase [Ensifer sp. Root231]KRC87706.1 inosine-5-monophosphate dehydrogenase [Ensifer sp. Root258]